MTKQEAIQQAYGEHWEAVKDYVRPDGSLKESIWKAIGIDNIFHHDFSTGYYRPKPLQGLETNREWIKIESEDDLPKETGIFWCILNNEIVFLQYWSEAKLWEDLQTENRSFPTHYQPIQKPQPPIY